MWPDYYFRISYGVKFCIIHLSYCSSKDHRYYKLISLAIPELAAMMPDDNSNKDSGPLGCGSLTFSIIKYLCNDISVKKTAKLCVKQATELQIKFKLIFKHWGKSMKLAKFIISRYTVYYWL